MSGWGDMLYMLLRLRVQIGWAQRVSLGFAFSACLGGLFDLLAVISRPLIISVLGLGLVAFLYHFIRAKAGAVYSHHSVELTSLLYTPSFAPRSDGGQPSRRGRRWLVPSA